MTKKKMLFQFVVKSTWWGMKLGVVLGALFGWGITGCAILPYGLLYLGVGLVIGLIIGSIAGLLNGILSGVISLTLLSSLEDYDQYKLALGISVFLLTVLGSFIGFLLLLTKLNSGLLALPAAIIAAIAAVYASQQIAQWYWDSRTLIIDSRTTDN